MAARAHNEFWLVEILKIFLLETTKPIELWLCRNDHWVVLCHVCFKFTYWFQRRRLLNIFPIGSYVKTMSADGGHLGWRSQSQDIILKVDLIGWNLKKSSCQKPPSQLNCDFAGMIIGLSCTKLVNQDHPMNIYGKFGWNLFSGFREEELNVKS
jgi:hypothetical protein